MRSAFRERKRVTEHELRLFVWKRRWWWTAVWADEPVGTADTPTHIRARSRARLLEKARLKWGPREPAYETVILDTRDSGK
jgi:hypothetical protein